MVIQVERHKLSVLRKIRDRGMKAHTALTPNEGAFMRNNHLRSNFFAFLWHPRRAARILRFGGMVPSVPPTPLPNGWADDLHFQDASAQSTAIVLG